MKCQAEDQAGYPSCDREAWYQSTEEPRFLLCEEHAHNNRFYAFQFLERVDIEVYSKEIEDLSGKDSSELAQLLVDERRRLKLAREELKASEEISADLCRKVHRNNLIAYFARSYGNRVWAVEGKNPPTPKDAECPDAQTIRIPVSQDKIVSIGYGYVVDVGSDSVTVIGDDGPLKYVGIRPDPSVIVPQYVNPGFHLGVTMGRTLDLVFQDAGSRGGDIAIVMRHFFPAWLYRKNPRVEE